MKPRLILTSNVDKINLRRKGNFHLNRQDVTKDRLDEMKGVWKYEFIHMSLRMLALLTVSTSFTFKLVPIIHISS